MATQEERWAAAEMALRAQSARRARRTPAMAIGITAVLVLAVGLTAVVDLRRLHTPGGTALAWTQAAVFGDCRAFLSLSLPADRSGERRTEDEICRDLRAATAPARVDSTRLTVRVLSVQQEGGQAVARVEVRGPEVTRTTALRLVRRGEGWLVVRRVGACGTAGCY